MQHQQHIKRLKGCTDVLLRVLTLALVSSLASTALAATFCPAPGDLPVNVGASPAGFPTAYDSAFSSIVHGDFIVDKSTETEGRVAVGGNYYQGDTTFYGIGGSGGRILDDCSSRNR